jgi:dihydrofolate reductase
MNTTRKYVASTTLRSPEWHNTTVMDGDLTETLTELKAAPGKNIMVNGSATLVRSLMRADLLDELRLFVHPVVVGSGQRLFDEATHAKLTLTQTKAYPSGVVSLTYRSVDA